MCVCVCVCALCVSVQACLCVCLPICVSVGEDDLLSLYAPKAIRHMPPTFSMRFNKLKSIIKQPHPALMPGLNTIIELVCAHVFTRALVCIETELKGIFHCVCESVYECTSVYVCLCAMRMV